LQGVLVKVCAEYLLSPALNRKAETMFATWTDEMVREYFDSHWDVTLHQLSALSGRTKADLKRVLMQG
jgi:hypothetical protein